MLFAEEITLQVWGTDKCTIAMKLFADWLQCQLAMQSSVCFRASVKQPHAETKANLCPWLDPTFHCLNPS